MSDFFNIKAFVISVCALFATSICQAKDDPELSNDDFLPVGQAPSDDVYEKRKSTPSEEPTNETPEETSDEDSPTKKKSKPKTSDFEEDDAKDFFDANYIRKAPFYDLPFANVEPSELSNYERDKLVAALKRRLSIYKYAVRKIETKIEDVSGENVSSSSRSSVAEKSVRMPVEVEGKEYDAVNGILVAKSKKSVATAFFAKIKGRNFIVTNMHVMQGDSDVNFRTYNGVEIKMPKVGFYSKGKDIFILPISTLPDGCIALPIEEDVSQNVAVGDKLITCGNSMGGGSFLHRVGEVVAVGPEIVEHNCNIQQGHSGSPIYSRKLKKVVGVLSHFMKYTYQEQDKKLGKNPNENLKIAKRDFGYRIDNIKEWSQIKTEKLIEASRDLEAYNEKFVNLARAIRQNLYTSASNYRDLNKIIVNFRSKNKGSSVAYKEAKFELLKDIKNLITHELASIKNKKLDEIFEDATLLIDALEELQTECDSMIRSE